MSARDLAFVFTTAEGKKKPCKFSGVSSHADLVAKLRKTLAAQPAQSGGGGAGGGGAAAAPALAPLFEHVYLYSRSMAMDEPAPPCAPAARMAD